MVECLGASISDYLIQFLEVPKAWLSARLQEDEIRKIGLGIGYLTNEIAEGDLLIFREIYYPISET